MSRRSDRKERKRTNRARRTAVRAAGKGKKGKSKRAAQRAARGGSRVGVAGRAVGRLAAKTAGSVLTAPLIPLKPFMKAALKKRGVSDPPYNTLELAGAFHEVVIQKKRPESFEERENFIEIAAALIPVVIGFIKRLIDAKKNGEPLDGDEQDLADDVEASGEAMMDAVEKASRGGGGSRDDDDDSDGGGGVGGTGFLGDENLFQNPLFLIGAAGVVFMLMKK